MRAARFVGLLALAAPAAAGAQIVGESGDVTVTRLRPGLGSDAILGVDGGDLPAAGHVQTAAFLGYGRQPLMMVGTLGGEEGDRPLGALIRNRVELDLIAGFAPIARLQLIGGLRATLYQDRDRMIPGVSGELAPLEPVGLGEVFAAVEVQLLVAERHGLDLSLRPELAFYPVPHNYFGEDALVFRPTVSGSRTLGAVRLAFEADYLLREEARIVHLEIDDEIEARLGAAYRVSPRLEVAAALAGAVAAERPFADAATTPVELLGGLRADLAAATELVVGTGVGFNHAHGNPLFRLFAGVQLGLERRRPAPPPALERTPPGPPVMPPDPVEPTDDRDRDGIPDISDGAPDAPEDRDAFADHDGIPDPDNDADGTLDDEDRCPLEHGPAVTGGCSDRDRDRDGVLDRNDLCPDAAGVAQLKGCAPPLASLTASKIELKEQVRFATGAAALKPESKGLLDAVAKILLEHRAVKVRIEGHTDAQGSATANHALSQKRAEAVRAYLIDRGVNADRMVAIGFGEARPLDFATTAEAHETNRRVELVVVE